MSGLIEDIAMLANDNPYEGSGPPKTVLRLSCREAARRALLRARNDISMTELPAGEAGDEYVEGARRAWHAVNDLLLELSGGEKDAPSRP